MSAERGNTHTLDFLQQEHGRDGDRQQYENDVAASRFYGVYYD